MDKLEALKKYFGHSAFREGQEGLIDAVLSGRDAMGVMPTGAGKSVCYQLPAMLLPGTTLVISPLISLMKDQVEALAQAGIPAAYINSSLTAAQYRDTLGMARLGCYKLIYVAPERLDTDGFLDFAACADISFVAVDEAHCVSQWGQDFRPSYLRIAGFIRSLEHRPAVGAFTATATEEVRRDIVELLELNDPAVTITSFDRANLYFDVVQCRGNRAKLDVLDVLLRERSDRSGIIYCSTRKTVESLCERLRGMGIRATRYHAGLPDEERRANQDDFIYDRARIMVATNAFGMGIDKSNVSFVIHFNMPKNLESYYQEAGRAGRDGSPADCILLYSASDFMTAKYFINGDSENGELSEEERELVRGRDLLRLQRMSDYCRTKGCFRRYILGYFGEGAPESCGCCGNCCVRDGVQLVRQDITIPAQKILSCVTRVTRRYDYDFGVTTYVRMLTGSRDKRLLALGMDQVRTYGIMKDDGRRRVREYMEYLIEKGYLAVSDDELRLVTLTDRAAEILFHGEKLTMPVRVPVGQPEEEGRAKGRRSRGSAPSAADMGLFEELKALRAHLARMAGVPAYVVFTNAALMDMASKKPLNMNDFMEVSGVGEAKAERYGEKFVAAVRKWVAEN